MRHLVHSQLALQDRVYLLAGVGLDALFGPLQVVEAASDYERSPGDPGRSRLALKRYQFLLYWRVHEKPLSR